MDKAGALAIVLAVMVALLGLMYLGWRGRQRRQAGLGRPAGVPADAGSERFAAQVLYVATTRADDPLDRIVIGGLGFRSRATLRLVERGIILGLTAQDDLFIAATDLIGADRATWTIDRVVEEDGLVLLRWLLHGEGGASTAVDTYLRFIEPGDRDAFLAVIAEIQLNSDTEGGHQQ